ncbi:MAG: o-succinylbenzoate synthase, partial [Chrysiogenetes bacterium]|nr:o-succinylbenzoate synthase [Chrysiogenetes bacterium]
AACRQLGELAAFDLDYVEQPLPPGSERDLSRLRDVPVSIALDESLRDESMVMRALEADWADYFILKPTVLGGFARTREVTERVRAHGKRYVLTTALAGATERRACFDLACLLPAPLPACGLNTAGFVDGDGESDGLCVSEGRMVPREIEAHERAAL